VKPHTPPHRILGRIAGILALWGLLVSVSPQAGASTARGNGGRTAFVEAGPPTDALVAAWSIDSGTPAPAWATEARGSLWQKIDQPFVPRAADDLAPHPILAGDAILFGTTRDEVRCVDRRTGAIRWNHFCGGPVRYAPTVAGDRVVVGADDGWIRALRLSDGLQLWAVRIGPAQPWISGNGRLISPHPIRSGPLVAEGTVYATAGLFPLEGTYLVALDLTDGALRWRRLLGNVSPQGYLVDAGADLIVPNGRATPRVYSRKNGDFRRELGSGTGTLAVVSDSETFTGPGATGAITSGSTVNPPTSTRQTSKIVSYPGRNLAVTPTTSYLVNEREILAVDRERLRTSKGDVVKATRWKRAVSGAGPLIVAGSHVFLGVSNTVQILRADTGEPGPTLTVDGPVFALAADDRTLAVSTTRGRITTFIPREAGPSSPPAPSPAPAVMAPTKLAAPLAEVLRTALGQLPAPRGWGLYQPPGPVGADDVLPALMAGSELQWMIAVPTSEVDAARRHLHERGWLGSLAAVVGFDGSDPVPVADHLFNLVVGSALSASEAHRIACPAPSGVVVLQGQILPGEAVSSTGRWTHQYGNAGNTCATSQSLRGFPRLQWFGGHGPERIPDRHTRGHAPLVSGGLIVTIAENGLIGTDARNGTVRWQLDLPDSMRYAMPYDGGYVVLDESGSRAWVAVNTELWEIEGRRGTVARRRPAPGRIHADDHWGWVARDGGRIFGSTMRPTAARTRKEYDLVDLDYRSGRPLVCSRTLCALEEASGSVLWGMPTEGAWVNATLCAAAGRVYAVEALGPKARADRTGRLTCAAILENAVVVCIDAASGKRVWERPLKWPEAEDILGLSVAGDRLILSCARSAGPQAAYHLRCWETSDGTERWKSSGRNPVHDLFHGQQVKRPVVLGERVCFESDLFDLATGTRWIPKGAQGDWILKRPGHACGGMTGSDDGLLFRADNPTFFRFEDGSFTRLSPTRPGCWLNILPAEGGILIPEASASCICGYPIQASLGFGFRKDAAPMLAEVAPRSP